MKMVTVKFLVEDSEARTVEEDIRNSNSFVKSCIFDVIIQDATDDEVDSYELDDDWEDDEDLLYIDDLEDDDDWDEDED